MLLKARYFPVILFVGCLLLLIIPFFYMEHRTITTSEQSKAPIVASTLKPPAMLLDRQASIDISNPRSELNEIPDGNAMEEVEESEQEEQPMDKSKQLQVPIKQLSFRGGNNNNLFPSNHLPFTIQKLNPRASEFALQMARDRLRIERYGMMMQNAQGNSSDDWENWVKESASDSNATKLQILIVSYFRGGTTFFGDLLNQHPGTYYHFEPLHSITGNDQVSNEEDIFRSVTLLRNLLQCEYDRTFDYIDWVRRDLSHRFLFEHNRRLWLSCQLQQPLCFDYKFLRSMCELHPVHLIKLVRLRLSHTRRLLDEFPRLKLIYLVRDPRGLYSSRRDLNWCNSTSSCIDPDIYCADMTKDLSAAMLLKSKYPQRFLALRYEDVALDTENQMKKVFQFLDLNYNRTYKQMIRFIDSHTKNKYRGLMDDGNPYSIRRDSRKTAFSWRQKLSPHEVSYVESACSDVIRQLALP
ncbi:hypothetical protein CHUAL_010863 [Chamberlinius hualienensis]